MATDTARTFVFPAHRVETARAIVEAANTKAARHGLPGYTTSEQTKMVLANEDGVCARYIEMCEFVVTGQTPRFAGWEFIGRVVMDEQAGALIEPLQGVTENLSAYRARGGECDHCRQNRTRNVTFLLRHESTGLTRQIGSTCVELFLGVKVSGLAYLAVDPFGELAEGDEDEEGFGYGRGGWDAFETRALLTVAAAVITTHGYVSRDDAEWERKVPTGEIVRSLLTKGFNAQDLGGLTEPAALADSARAWAIAQAGQPGADEFARNLAQIVAAEAVSERKLGMAVYAVEGYRRAQAKAAREVAKSHSTAQGAAKEKITRTVTVTSITAHEGQAYGYGDPPTRYKHTMIDAAGNVYVWWTGKRAAEEGDTLVMTGTVKKHEEFRGLVSTVVLRVKFAPVAQKANA